MAANTRLYALSTHASPLVVVWKPRLMVGKAMLTIVVSRNTTNTPRLPSASTSSAPDRRAAGGGGATGALPTEMVVGSELGMALPRCSDSRQWVVAVGCVFLLAARG
jgi:hypothetical protein